MISLSCDAGLDTCKNIRNGLLCSFVKFHHCSPKAPFHGDVCYLLSHGSQEPEKIQWINNIIALSRLSLDSRSRQCSTDLYVTCVLIGISQSEYSVFPLCCVDQHRLKI